MSVLTLGTLELAYSHMQDAPTDWTVLEEGDLRLDTDPYTLRVRPVEASDYLLGKAFSLTLKSMRQARGQGERSFESSGDLLEFLARGFAPEPDQAVLAGFMNRVIGEDFHLVMTRLLVEALEDGAAPPPVWWRLRCYLKGAAVPDEWFYSLKPRYVLSQAKPALHPLPVEASS